MNGDEDEDEGVDEDEDVSEREKPRNVVEDKKRRTSRLRFDARLTEGTGWQRLLNRTEPCARSKADTVLRSRTKS